MQTDFEILTKFLVRSGAEVEGRISDVPDSDAIELFRKFANGKATPEERARMVKLVDSRPDWIAALAEEIKQRRQRTKSKGKP